MPLAKGTKIRAGDVVAIYCRVECDLGPDWAKPYRIALPGGASHYVGLEDIEAVVTRGFAPGDVVLVDGWKRTTVLAVHGSYLWLASEDGPYTRSAKDCSPVTVANAKEDA